MHTINGSAQTSGCLAPGPVSIDPEGWTLAPFWAAQVLLLTGDMSPPSPIINKKHGLTGDAHPRIRFDSSNIWSENISSLFEQKNIYMCLSIESSAAWSARRLNWSFENHSNEFFFFFFFFFLLIYYSQLTEWNIGIWKKRGRESEIFHHLYESFYLLMAFPSSFLIYCMDIPWIKNIFLYIDIISLIIINPETTPNAHVTEI